VGEGNRGTRIADREEGETGNAGTERCARSVGPGVLASFRFSLSAFPLRLLVLAALLPACAPTQVKITRESDAVGVPKPSAVYVYDFAVEPSEIQLDRGGPLARLRERLAGGGDDQDAQAVALGHQVANGLADALVAKITAMGLAAQRITRNQAPPPGAAAVAGQFVDVDEGNRVRRMAIGFHQGQSQVSARVQLYTVTGAKAATQLLDFTASAESAPLPGAAVTMGAGAAVQVAAAASGAKELRDTVQADANNLADRIATLLQTFFAKQGWTAPPSSPLPF
jgi:Domain of unknown function (DUF4410)